MSNPVVQGLFVLACAVPPLVLAASALLLLVKTPATRTAPLSASTPAGAHR